MKTTKEEILKKHCKNSRGHWIGITKEGVLKAIQEYAETYHKEKLKEELLQKIIEKQVTPTSPIERKDFFESQMEEPKFDENCKADDDFVKLHNRPQGELYDIIECIKNFDDKETLAKKGRYFEVIQRDLRQLKPQPEETLRDELKKFNDWMCGEQYDGKIPLIDTCIDDYLKSKE